MFNKSINILLIFCLLPLLLWAQPQALRKPKLTVVIAVEGLKSDHIATLWNVFGNGGFKRIIGEGAYISKAKCNYIPAGEITDYATIFTGTVPYFHGITSEKYYNLVEDAAVSFTYDSRYKGIACAETVSPRRLLSTTIADEVALSQSGQSKIYAFALQPDDALMMGGHLANAAIWIDDQTGNLCTTNFYEKGLPSWVEKMNIDYTVSDYMNQQWTPMQAIDKYLFAPCTKKQLGNKWLFYDSNDYKTFSQQISTFKQTPAVNSLMRNLAVKTLREAEMGEDDFTDMLCVQFTVNSPFQKNDNTMCLEQEDLYLRLDKEIRYLLDAIDISVGMNNAVVVLITAQDKKQTSQFDSDLSKKIPSGQFNTKRSLALLNSYLMAIYGQGQWINDYYNRNIYLNHALINSNKINKQEMEMYAAQFLTEFEGIQNAFTSTQIQNAGGNDIMIKIRNGYHKNVSGDIVFTLLPGWSEVDLNKQVIEHPHQAQTNIPIAFYGFGIKAQEIKGEINMEDIAPTLSDLLRINYPNGCIGKPILSITSADKSR